jgi:hypothetical protein
LITSQYLKIALVISGAFLCAFIIYFAIIACLVNPYIQTHTWKQISDNLDLYESTTKTSENSIYFLGNSQVMHDFDPVLVQEYLKTENLTFRVYNVGVDDDTPLQRLTELQGMIRSKPKIVIIGYSYTSFSNLTRYVPDDNLALLSGRIVMDGYSRSLYTKEQLALIDQNTIEQQIFKRKFIIPAIRSLLGIHLQERANIVNDTMSLEQKNIIAKIPYDAFLAPVYQDDNNQKRAFVHLNNELAKNNISVIYVNMPLDPLRSGTIPDTTRENFFTFMNSTGVKNYDFEQRYAGYDFHDLVHQNKYGREKFSRDIASIISREVNGDAV